MPTPKQDEDGPPEIDEAMKSVKLVLEALPIEFSQSDLCPSDHLMFVLGVLASAQSSLNLMEGILNDYRE